MKVGETWLLSVPPSWMIAGTISAITATHVVLSDGVYIESVSQGATVSDVPAAQDPRELAAVVKSAHPLVDGTIVRLDGILMAAPCASSMRSLARSREANAIKGA